MTLLFLIVFSGSYGCRQAKLYTREQGVYKGRVLASSPQSVWIADTSMGVERVREVPRSEITVMRPPGTLTMVGGGALAAIYGSITAVLLIERSGQGRGANELEAIAPLGGMTAMGLGMFSLGLHYRRDTIRRFGGAQGEVVIDVMPVVGPGTAGPGLSVSF